MSDGRRPTERVLRVEEPEPASRRLRFHGARVALVVVLAMVTYLLFPASPAVDVPIFEVGAVATDNVIAPFAYTVRKGEADLARERDELGRTTKPVYAIVPAALDSSQAAVDRFASAVAAASQGVASARAAAPAVQRAAAAGGVTLSPQEAEYLAYPARREALREAAHRVFARWLGAGVAASGALDGVRGEVTVRRGTDERTVLADSVLTQGQLLSRARLVHPDPTSQVGDALFLKLITTSFHPTVVLDREATEHRRQLLRASVSPTRFEVRAGEKVIGEHEVVGRDEHDKLRALHDAMASRAQGEHALGRVAGTVLYNALVLLIFGLTVVMFRPALYRQYQALLLFGAVFAVVLVGAALAGYQKEVHPELIPVAFAAVIWSILFDPRISMIGSMILAVLIGGQSVYRGTNALFINLIVGAAAAISVRIVRRRDAMFLSILVVAAAYVLSALAVGLTLDWTFRQIAHSAGFGTLNALASVAVAMMLLPLAEKLAGVTTDLTLLEYSDLNNPLLKRLMMEAPGTHSHTMRVANLVEAACNAIGANGLLGRVGTYYHDIGKLKKPQYFVENQERGRNPHDKLKPNTSATIIRNHVREGLELANEYHLPRAIAAFIPEHHGTNSIAYFMEKARERDGSVNPVDFTYPGPIPQTAETAVLMLADGVEAATHVLSDPTPARVRDVIDRIVQQRIEQGQLRDAPLTLAQIEQLKEEFARVLTGMYHNRIDYPTSTGGVSAEFGAVQPTGEGRAFGRAAAKGKR